MPPVSSRKERGVFMSRIARVVVPGSPHHVIQRGNRRQKVFFSDEDKSQYLLMMMREAKKESVSFLAYCLMDNHVHLIVVPETKAGMARAIGESHRKFTRMINFREGWRGYLWQGRFSSFPLDSQHLYHAVRYVERNPVRAGIVRRAEDYKWSSARAHVERKKDPMLIDFSLTEEIKDWSMYLREQDEEEKLLKFRKHIETGRPLGDKNFIRKLEGLLGRILHKQKPGPKTKR